MFYLFSVIIPYFYILPFWGHKTKHHCQNCLTVRYTDSVLVLYRYVGHERNKIDFTQILYTLCSINHLLDQCRKLFFSQLIFNIHIFHFVIVEWLLIAMPINCWS